MPDTPIDNRALLRRTLMTAGAMVGACVVLVGTLSLVLSTIVGRAVNPPDVDRTGSASSAGVGVRPPVPGMAGGKLQMPPGKTTPK